MPALAQTPPLLPPPPALPPAPRGEPAAPSAEPAVAPAAPDREQPLPAGLTPANRDPFWPVGYAPRSAEDLESDRLRNSSGQGKTDKPRWTEARESLRIGGYMKGPRGYTALVNNALIVPGDLVTHAFEGKVYRWKVDAISTRGISFIPLDWMPAGGSPPKTGKDRP